MFRIALASTLARRRRLATTAAAVVISVAFISGTMALSGLLDRAVDDLVSDSYRGIDAVVRSSVSQETQFGATAYREPIPSRMLGPLAALPGVRAAEGVVIGSPTLVGRDGHRVGTAGFSTTIGTNWLDDDALRGRVLLRGRAPRSAGEITLDERTATQERFAVGDDMIIQAPAGSGSFRVVGVTALRSTGDRLNAVGEVRFTTAEAQRLFARGERFDQIVVAGRPRLTEAALVTLLRPHLAPGTQAITGTAFTAESRLQLSAIVSLVTDVVLAFGWISVFVGVFVITNTFSIVVAQRSRELALLRAVGASRRQILGSVLVEAVVIGLAAAVVGIIGGVGLAGALSAGLRHFIDLPGGVPGLSAGAVVLSFAVAVGATVVAALAPAGARRARPPVAAMSGAALDRSGSSSARRRVGSALFVGAAVTTLLGATGAWEIGTVGVGAAAAALVAAAAIGGPVVVGPFTRLVAAPLSRTRGVAGRIAARNAARNPRRTATAAAALMIGVALVSGVATFAASLEGSLSSVFAAQLARVDAVIDAGIGDGGVPIALRPALAGIPGIEDVTSVRWTPVDILNSAAVTKQRGDDAGAPASEPRWMLGVDSPSMLRMVTLAALTPAISRLGPDEVMLTRAVAERNGWSVGDHVRVRFARTGQRTLRIAATFDERLSGGEYFIDLSTFDANALPDLMVDSQVWLRFAPGAAKSASAPVRAAMARIAPAAEMNDVRAFIDERSSLLSPLLNVVNALLAFAIVIALFGVANTISLSIHERSRELALLRAVGMERTQLRSSVRWESAVIALLGTVAGACIGVPLAATFVVVLGENGVAPIVPWGRITVIVTLGVVAGLLSAVGPARRTSRLEMLTALGGE